MTRVAVLSRGCGHSLPLDQVHCEGISDIHLIFLFFFFEGGSPESKPLLLKHSSVYESWWTLSQELALQRHRDRCLGMNGTEVEGATPTFQRFPEAPVTSGSHFSVTSNRFCLSIIWYVHGKPTGHVSSPQSTSGLGLLGPRQAALGLRGHT